MKKTQSDKIIKQVKEYCENQGLRFTDPRRMVLEIIASSEVPIGAYDILSKLGKQLKDPKPPTAYRAIEFLTEHGFIHKIESLNAFVLCCADHKHQGSQFMICSECRKVSETHLCKLPQALAEKAQAQGFEVQRWNVELHGLCKKCSS